MHTHSATNSGVLLIRDTYVRMYAWGILECRPRYIYIYIYIFTISMSHDLKVSSLTPLARCN